MNFSDGGAHESTGPIDALTEAPRKCRCGKKLPKPRHEPAFPESKHARNDFGATYNEPRWCVKCTCGTVYLWSFPHEYRESHVLYLGRNIHHVEVK